MNGFAAGGRVERVSPRLVRRHADRNVATKPAPEGVTELVDVRTADPLIDRWAAATYVLSSHGTAPTSGRPSREIGRAQLRTEMSGALASPGTYRAPRARSRSTNSAARGSPARNVDPRLVAAPADTRLNSIPS